MVCLFLVTGAKAQTTESSGNSAGEEPPAVTTVPRLIQFRGVLRDLAGQPLTGTVEVQFAIYQDQADAAAIWEETQTLPLDARGHYTVLLGAMQPQGLPMELFTSGGARWLGVSAAGAEAQPRTLLVSVPYALKAGDAQTLGGKPASAYMLSANPVEGISLPPLIVTAAVVVCPDGTTASPSIAGLPCPVGAPPSAPITGGGTANYAAMFTGTSTIGNSAIYNSLRGFVGIGTTSPSAPLSVSSASAPLPIAFPALVAVGAPPGTMPLALRQNAAASLTPTLMGLETEDGKLGSLGAGGSNIFRIGGETGNALALWSNAAEQVRIDPSGNVGVGIQTPAAKLEVNGTAQFDGAVTFASTETTTGNISTGNQLISTVATGTAPLSVTSTTQVPNLNASLLDGLPASAFQPVGSYATLGANTFVGTQTINGDLVLPQTSGLGNAGIIFLGGTAFLHAFGSNNTFLGQGAGNFSMTGAANTATGFDSLDQDTTGTQNTASGYQALYANTTGSQNTGSGYAALSANTKGNNNTASGYFALAVNQTGNQNTASGASALFNNTTGSNNAASGYQALYSNTTGGDNTAVGFQAGVTATPANANITGANNTFIGYGSGPGTSTQLNNATAIGANALVSASNALVLGATGVNVGIGTPAPAATLEVNGTAKFDGAVTFVSTETTTGNISTSNQLISTVATGTAPLQVASTTQVPNLNASLLDGLPATAFQPVGAYATLGANTFAADQTLNTALNLAQTTGADVGVINLGGSPFLHACCSADQANTFVGSNAGNFTTTGIQNTASGDQALVSTTSGSDNTASGFQALRSNTYGGYNTASGVAALTANTTGRDNTASGYYALGSNTSGIFNTAVGFQAGVDVNVPFPYLPTTGSNSTFIGANATATVDNLTNAAAIGYGAQVGESNALVLGGTGGNAVNVGIGTTTPAATLDVAGNINSSGTVTASAFSGNGAGLTGVTTSGLAAGTYGNAYTFNNAANSFTGNGAGLTGVTTSGLAAGNYSNAYTFSNAANSFTGNGAGLTGVTTSGLAAGTYSNAYTFNNAANSFTAASVTAGSVSASNGVVGTSSTGNGVYGLNSATTGNGSGVQGISNSSTGFGVAGSGWTGVLGATVSSNGYGVYGQNSASTGNAYGVYGTSTSNFGYGVYGIANSSNLAIAVSYGVYGQTNSVLGAGVYGSGNNGVIGAGAVGVWGAATSAGGDGVYGSGYYGVEGYSTDTTGYGAGVYGSSASPDAAWAGFFNGDVHITNNVTVAGTLSASSKNFLIDDPLDAANKYLYHSSVESSEMMNIYTGNVLLDASGEAVVQLPDWFETLNTDFRYQLTAIGAPGPNLYIAQEVQGNSFRIAGGSPGTKVSWQVTGVRQDAYAKAHALEVEVDKPASERGYYIHPELYGQPKEKGIDWRNRPPEMRQPGSVSKLPEPPGGGVR